MNEKVCPLMSAGAGSSVKCIGRDCAWSIEAWNPFGSQVTCLTWKCAISELAEPTPDCEPWDADEDCQDKNTAPGVTSTQSGKETPHNS